MGTTPFPSFMEMPKRVPPAVWRRLRFVSLAGALGIVLLLIADPNNGLLLLWSVLIPLLPIVFFAAPGLWRNLCPLAAANQSPRTFGFSKELEPPVWFREYAFVIAAAAFFVLVATRKALFNENALASAVLVGGALLLAFTGGVLFRGKSGWCSSVCPLLPVQRVYGQEPFALVPNAHCQPCVGCTKNCYDFNPRPSWLADLADPDERYSARRRLFAGAFPGLVLGYFLVPDPPDIGIADMYVRMSLAVLASTGSLFALEALLRVSSAKLTALYGAFALNAFYWYATPAVVENLTDEAAPASLLWTTRALLVAATAVWLYRAFAKERVFLEAAAAPPGVRLPDTPALARANVAPADEIEVTFAPQGRRFVAKPGNTLLEVAEANGMLIEAGCRMGMCGADPVAIEDGANGLSEMTSDEQTTLERLGLAQSTRLACCARVSGPVTVALDARREESAPAKGEPPPREYDPTVERVVVLGNGVAGITAADHIRRRHPDCSIDVVADEIHHFYNRMAISRLIYGRSAMQGLFLLPDSWYQEKRITAWLNTRAVAIDREAHVVRLGTEEQLPYDRLVLAMGSSSAIPPISGFGLAGSFVLRKAEDALELRAFVQEHSSRRAVVGGGGLLGLEAAYALHKLGLRVTVLERSTRLLRRQLDTRASALLRAYLEGLAVRIVLQSEAAGVHGNGRVAGVMLADGQTLATDVFLLCAGIRPNVTLAHEAGLATDRGVIVDDRMRTTDPLIYAAGDVAQHREKVSGIWPVAVEQAKVAAENITGANGKCSHIVPVTTLKVAGIDLTSIGQFEARDPHEEEIVHEDAGAGRYRKLVLRKGRARGAILLGAPGDTPAVCEAVQQEADVSAVVGELHSGDWSAMGLPRHAPSQSARTPPAPPARPQRIS